MWPVCGKKCIQSFGWKPEWNRPLGRLRLRWENNIIIDLTETGWLCELEGLAQNRDKFHKMRAIS
jgi:hypothetical protein